MANPEFYLCDGCGVRVNKDCRSSLPTDRKADPAGSMETEHVIVDLCGKCASGVLHFLGNRRTQVKGIEPYAVGQVVKNWLAQRAKVPVNTA